MKRVAGDAQSAIPKLSGERFYARMTPITGSVDLPLMFPWASRGPHRRLYLFSTRIRMSDFQTDMNRAVQGFVAQITELARRAALDTLESAFGGRAPRSSSTATAAIAVASAPASSGRVGRPR